MKKSFLFKPIFCSFLLVLSICVGDLVLLSSTSSTNPLSSKVNNNVSKKNESQTHTFTQTYYPVTYRYDNKVFDNALGIMTTTNENIFNNDDYLKINYPYASSRSKYSLFLEKTGGHWHLSYGDAPITNAQSTNQWAASLGYNPLISKDQANVIGSDTINFQDNGTLVNGKKRWNGTSENGVLFSKDKYLNGVIQINTAYWPGNYDGTSWGQNKRFSQIAIGDNKSMYPWTYLKWEDSSKHPFKSIDSFNSDFFNNNKVHSYASGWSRFPFVIAIIDDMLWFTSQPSRIESITFKASEYTVEELRANMSNVNWFNPSKFNIDLLNTPKAVVQKDQSWDSSFTVSIDDSAQTVTFTVNIPRSYIPDYRFNSVADLINSKWIVDTPMTKSVTYNFSDFKRSDTTIKQESISSTQHSTISLNNLAPYELLNRNADLSQFIFDNRNVIFNNIPGWTSSNFRDYINIDSFKRISSTSTSLRFSFTVNSVYNNTSYYVDNKEFILEITDLTNKDTRLIDTVAQNGIDASDLDLTAADFYPILLDSNKQDILKKWIVNKSNNIFDNNNLSSINDITYLYARIDNSTSRSVDVQIKIRNSYKNGAVYSGEVDYTIKLNNLPLLKNTLEIKEVEFIKNDLGSVASSNIKPSEYNNNSELSNVITSKLNANYFENLPNFGSEKVEIVSTIANDKSGVLYANYKLPSFYYNGLIVDKNNPNYDNWSFTYRATITGFKTQQDISLSLTKNLNANNSSLNAYVSNGQLTNAYDYKNAIKNQLIQDVNSANTVLPNKQEVINYINGNDFINNSQWNISMTANNQAEIILKSDRLFDLTKIAEFKQGVIYRVNNIIFNATSISNNTENQSLSLNEFKVKSLLEKINILNLVLNNTSPDLYNGNDYTSFNEQNFNIEAVGDNTTGNAIITIRFKTIYLSNNTFSDYEYKFNYKFKTTIEMGNNNYLKDNINSSDIDNTWTGTIIEVYHLINTTSQNINWNNKKAELFSNNIDVNNYELAYVSISYNTSNPNHTLDLVLSVKNVNTMNVVNEVIKLTGFNALTIEATNPQIKVPLPTELNFTSTDNDYLIHVDKVLEYKAGKIPTNNTDIQITSAKINLTQEKFNNKNIVFVNYMFNGIYLSDKINSFIDNYTVMVKFEYDITTNKLTHMSFSNANSNDIINYQTNNQNLWIFILISSIVFAILASLIAIILYRRYKKKGQ